MNRRLVSFVALLFCLFVFCGVALFGYSQYRKAQARNADFSRALVDSQERMEASPLMARMPTQLPPGATSVLAGETPAPQEKTPP